MKVLAINGSARKDGNTAIMVRAVFAELEKEGIETRLEQLHGTKFTGCTACYECFKRKDKRCAVKKDKINDLIELMVDADGIILASPTYFADVTAGLRAVIERSGMVARACDDMFARKVGAAVVTMRRGGGMQTFNSLNSFFFIGQMIVPGSSYWNMGFGREIGQVEGDQEGLKTMADLGRNMAWLMKKLQG
ncbi:flavodoxin family protein [Fundidesulfovibrio terrae]|uniref:flavodoxin family protein n=1 Tax=Fundidesulfovibrio terrae TaxID=2922866 RepID=UPI001FAF4012|nr:flavodoxin family protein [Fundidesulfovibrio terrae]